MDNIENCKKHIIHKLPEATNFIKNWLNNPITKNKIEKLNKINKQRLNEVYSIYFYILNNIEIVVFSESKIHTIAYVQGNNPLRVNMNCHYISNEDVVDTLIHEIQHLLWFQFPMNPEKLLIDVFIKEGREPKTLNENLETSKEDFEDLKNQLIKLKINNNRIVSIINKWVTFYRGLSIEQRRYACNENEKMSNILQLRRFFKIQPGEDITLEMILPYITFEKKTPTDLTWVLLCWAINGFNDITKMLNSINDLAVNNNDKPLLS